MVQHNRNHETDLVEYLLTGYNRQARPVEDVSKPVNVTIGLNMGKLIDLVRTCYRSGPVNSKSFVGKVFL